MKKLFLFALLVFLCSCRYYNPSGKESRYIVVTNSNDSIEVNADSWEWNGGSVYFFSENGVQFVKDVKHIMLKE